MDYAVVTVPAAPVRRKPDHRKEMVNQLLFGEYVKVEKHRGDRWIKIRSLHDDYGGWMTISQLKEASKKDSRQESRFVTAELYTPVTLEGQSIYVPAGASLPGFASGSGQLVKGISYSCNGTVADREQPKNTVTRLTELARAWLGAPYLWGGRTPMGVDCSGFTQVLFKMIGIDLPRDAWQQAQEGSPVEPGEVQPGDLAFFDNREDIVHVGMYLSTDKMIHASGRVRIDTIDKKGVTDAVTGKTMYTLKAIRRLL